MKIKIEISVGELLDKISILSIKREKIKDSQKLLDIEKELRFLEAHAKNLQSKDIKKYEEFLNKLKLINSRLWEIEDEIRIFEKKQDFNEEFISLARDVYFTNDKRFLCKNEINDFYGSEIKEVKEYVDYKSNEEN
tara:strand:- start:334 stop:741 length:408 start_codon:yes stop_codon:yes gene_type:complete